MKYIYNTYQYRLPYNIHFVLTVYEQIAFPIQLKNFFDFVEKKNF